jgi:hypothetical protein
MLTSARGRRNLGATSIMSMNRYLDPQRQFSLI